jgi:type II secretory pathway component PulF
MIEYLSNLLTRLHFRTAVRKRTWKKLGMQVRYGMTFKDALQNLHTQYLESGSPLAGVLGAIHSRHAGGHTIGTALLGYAGYEEIMLISAGENSDKLSESLLLAADLLEAKRKILQAVVGALVPPFFAISAYVLCLYIVAIYLIPMFAMLSDPAKWTGAASMLYMASSFVNSIFGLIVPAAGIALVFVMFWSLPNWTGALRVRADRLPPWSIYRLTVGAVWLYTLSIFMQSGMQLTDILDNMQSSEAGSPYLRERAQSILGNSRNGESFGEALYLCGMNFPDAAIVDDLRVFADMPDFMDRLFEIAKDWLTDGVELVQKQAGMVNYACMFVIVLSIIVFAFAAISLDSQLEPRGFGY